MRAVGAETDGTEPAGGVVLVQRLVVGPAVQAEDLVAMSLRPMLAIVQQRRPGALRSGSGSQVVQVKGAGAFLAPETVIVNASKRLENGSCLTMSRVLQEELPELAARYAVLSGPSFAAEVMDAQPTAVVLGCRDETLGAMLRSLFSTPFFRCYSSTDVTGVETGGALKNVMAIAAGVCTGLGFGSNASAALITRGLAELSRLGVAMGARPLTFMGLSGLGDLVLTCTGGLSRNRQVGERLGRGESLEAIVSSLGMVAEGVKTAGAARQLAARFGIEAPVTEAVCRILYEGTGPETAVRDLMDRPLKEE